METGNKVWMPLQLDAACPAFFSINIYSASSDSSVEVQHPEQKQTSYSRLDSYWRSTRVTLLGTDTPPSGTVATETLDDQRQNKPSMSHSRYYFVSYRYVVHKTCAPTHTA